MTVFIPGGCGYIGAMLVPFLLADGHKVTVLDTMWFGSGHLPDNPNLTIIKGDIRDKAVLKDASTGCDAVIWLASVSNNAMYAVNGNVTHEVNTSVAYIPCDKFIYASSAAVCDPTSDYTKDKLACEAALKDTGAIIVRAASVCGYSPHMRFDLTLNKMAHDAYRKGIIKVNGGDQVRFHVHMKDLCEFYRLALTKAVAGETYTVFNVGLTIKNAADVVVDVFEKYGRYVRVEMLPATDNRSWPPEQFIGDSMRSIGAENKKAVWDGVREIIDKLDAGYWLDSETNAIYQNIATSLS